MLASLLTGHFYAMTKEVKDPYVLISILSEWKVGAWTIDEVQGTLKMLFEKQYILTEEVVRETRYRTETRTGTRLVYDEDLDEYVEEEYEYEAQMLYTQFRAIWNYPDGDFIYFHGKISSVSYTDM